MNSQFENWYKIAKKNLKEVQLKGVIQQTDKGFVYVKISNDVIHGFFKLIDEEGIEEPPYFGKGDNKIGAHISLINDDELEKGQKINLDDFNKKMAEHQKLSHTSSQGMFKGGLANHNEKTIKLHTTHHLLLAGLQAVVDKNIKQRGMSFK